MGSPTVDFDGTLAMLQQEAQVAVEHLAFSLHERGLLPDAKHAKAGRVVAVALEEIAAQRDALDEYAARSAHQAELADEGVQELRLGVLPVAVDIAARAVDHADEPLLVREVERVTVGVAERLAEWVATGRYDWMAEDSRVSAEERSDDTKNSPKIGEVG